MEWTTLILITIAILIVALASGMRIFIGLILVGIAIIWIGLGVGWELNIAFATWNGLTSFTMVAIPLFVFMGEIIYKTGLSKRAYKALEPTMNHLPGGLLHTNVVVGAFFAAATGSSLASAATIGSIALPDMKSRGYDLGLSFGSVAAGGSLGILIPPSITMIVYGSMVNVSVGKLFIAGILPGLLLTLMYMAYIFIVVSLKPSLVRHDAAESMPWGASLKRLIDAWPIILLAVLIMGTIYLGIATPTEAAGMGCFFALLIALGYRCLTWKTFKAATVSAVKTTVFIMLIFTGARIMGVLLSNLGVFSEMSKWVIGLPVAPVVIMLLIILMYLILGMFMSGLPAILITLPVIFPIVTALGYDPIWFGIIIVLVDEAGLLSPPVGNILYILMGLSPETPFWTIAKGCLPFFGVICACTIVLMIFPQIATWLPTLMLGS